MNIRLVDKDYKHKNKKGFLAFYTSEKDLIINVISHQDDTSIPEALGILKEIEKLELDTSKFLLIEKEDVYYVYSKLNPN